MSRRPKSPDAKLAPSKDEILSFLAGQTGKVGKREIARAFGVGSAGRIALKRTLKELEGDGLIERRRRMMHKAGDLPPVVVGEVTGRDGDGELLAEPVEWDRDAHGAPPRIRILIAHRRRPDAPAPGIGDRALLRVEKERDEDGLYAARIIKLISHRKERQIGIFRASPDGGGRLVPVDKRARGVELVIPPGQALEAADGDLVAVETDRSSRLGPRSARVREKLGSVQSERAISLIAIHAHEIPHVFSPAALAEAAAAREATLAGRQDWRDLPLVTIDPVDAKDHDDAVFAAPDPDPSNPGGHIVHIAIADVAAYVRPGSALDREALERGNSVYFPDRVVPMLPERISNDLCSLKPGVDRAALGLRIIIDAKGKKLSQSAHRVLIRSVGKLAYEQAQAARDGRPDEITGPLRPSVLDPLYAAYASLKTAREAREPLELDLPERKLVLDGEGRVERVVVPMRLDAHRLIEEFMILANVAAAELLETAKLLFLYRVHDAPSLEKMQGLRDFLETIGISLPKAGAVRPSLFNRILARVAGADSVHLVNEVILRSQSQAEYGPDNYGHFGLNLRRYAHFTSPIRRYADVIVHRALIRALALGSDGAPDIGLDQMRAIGAQVSAAERRAMAAERETVDRLIAHYLVDQVGAVFPARVGGVTKAGLFVRLDETGADGFVPASTLGDDYFRYDEEARSLSGSRTGETFRLGDAVRVRLMEALPVAGALRFEVISTGTYVKSATRRHRLGPPGRAPARGGRPPANAAKRPRVERQDDD